MKFISQASISLRIQKMKERVRWQHPSIMERSIDQTCMVLDDGKQDNPDFSFMVIGDSGTKPHHNFHPQRKVAEMMLPHQNECSFVLHTGDVIYVVGSHEYYPQNFIEPYREFLEGGESPKQIAFDRITFKTPILPVLGNHDYYDVPLISRLVSGSTLMLRRLFKYKDIEIGWHGSGGGNAYARAFIDCLDVQKSPQMLGEHLDTFYSAKTDTGRCLRYEPGFFTRVPNRYYTFRYGGIDFFALDSDTFNLPFAIPATREGESNRRELEKNRRAIEVEEIQILDARAKLNPENAGDAEQLDALNAKLNQIDEIKIDIEKQLAASATHLIDWEQLDWLKQRLIESWHTKEVRGRVLYFHHPPYVTEASKWHQAQTLAVRHRLREVFDSVAQTLGSRSGERPIVDLIFNGHAHCLEYLRTTDTGHADSHINCIVSGGSGHRPRRQRQEGNELMERFVIPVDDNNFPQNTLRDRQNLTTSMYRSVLSQQVSRKVADSYLFVGRNGYDFLKKLPYSFVRIDVKAGNPPKFMVRPFVTERYQGEWFDIPMKPFEL
ncbi:MAG: metallophosphoesterase [Calothrix sp. CSU_2_0]|nr:metallophosphoesterase [Calothrix sp. CSU_2_0]